MESPKLSIVILSYNRKDSLKKSLEEIKKISYPNFEIILIDNASDDGTVEFIKNNHPQINLIESSGNVGIKALNTAYQKAKGKYILTLDDDSYPLSNNLKDLIEKLEKNKKIGLLAAQIINPGNKIQWPTNTDQKCELTHYIGCGFLISKNLFEQIGYNPKKFFLFYNEQWVSFKIMNLGYKIIFDPSFKIFHQAPPSDRFNTIRMFYTTRNRIWWTIKFDPWKILFSDLLSFLYSQLLLAKKYQELLAYFKAVCFSLPYAFILFFQREPCDNPLYLKEARIFKNLAKQSIKEKFKK